MPLNLSTGFSDIGNAIGNMALGKKNEEKQQAAIDLEQRMQALREAQAQLDQQRGAREETLMGLDKERAQREQAQFESNQAQIQRGNAEHDQALQGLRARALQINPKLAGVGQMDEASLHEFVSMHDQEQARIAEIQMQRDMQLRGIRGAQMKAQSDLQVYLNQITQAQQMVLTNPTLRPVYESYLKGPMAANAMDLAIKMGGQMGLINGGATLQARYGDAARRVIESENQLMSLGVPSSGNSPLVASGVKQAMPFGYLDPQQQSDVISDVQSALMAGKPLNTRAYMARGVPIQQIAGQAGYNVDPITGAATKLPPPTPPGGEPPPPNPYPSPASMNQGGPGMHIGPFTLGGAPTGPTGPASPPPTPAAAAAAPPAHQAAPPTAAPAAPIGGQVPAPMPPTPEQQVTALQMARDIPSAEQAARNLLDNGMPYDQAMALAPPSMQSMLQARIPKRIVPAQSATFAPPAAPQPPLPQLNATAPGFATPGGKPNLFSPPGF